MIYTKIVGFSQSGSEIIESLDYVGSLTHLEIHPVKEGGAYFVCMPTFPTARFELAKLPGVIVFDNHLNQKTINPTHHSHLEQHGIDIEDTPWQAHEKLAKSLGLSETMMDPNC